MIHYIKYGGFQAYSECPSCRWVACNDFELWTNQPCKQRVKRWCSRCGYEYMEVDGVSPLDTP